MADLKGWGLTARLITKHFSKLGDKVSEAIANFDPETATEADRDRLETALREAAEKLAAARRAFAKEHDDVVKLRHLIATDEKAAGVLAIQLARGEIDEATVTLFCDELESNRARLPQEVSEEAEAKGYMDELQSIVEALGGQLQEFDRIARQARQELARAESQKELQALRAERLQQMTGLRDGLGQSSTALDALARRTRKLRDEADGLKIVADINQKPLERAAAVDAARKAAAQNSAPAESAADRLHRLSGGA